MATKESMVTYMTGFVNKVIALFAKTKAQRDHLLYVDNNDGVFSFKTDFAVGLLQIGITTSEVNAAKAAIAANYPNGGNEVINAVTRQIETYDSVANTWSSSPTDYFNRVKQRRVYFSSWSSRVYTADSYGDLRRFRTGGLTLIG